MLPGTTQIYITDKNGGKHFNTLCSTAYVAPEHRTLERHLAQAAKYPAHYKFLDVPTARIERIDADALPEMTDDEILTALGI